MKIIKIISHIRPIVLVDPTTLFCFLFSDKTFERTNRRWNIRYYRRQQFGFERRRCARQDTHR